MACHDRPDYRDEENHLVLLFIEGIIIMKILIITITAVAGIIYFDVIVCRDNDYI